MAMLNPAPSHSLTCDVCCSVRASSLDRMISHSCKASGKTLDELLSESCLDGAISPATFHRLVDGQGTWSPNRIAWATNFIGTHAQIAEAMVRQYKDGDKRMLPSETVSKLDQLAYCCPVKSTMRDLTRLAHHLETELTDFAKARGSRLYLSDCLPWELLPERALRKVVGNWVRKSAPNNEEAYDAAVNLALRARRAFMLASAVHPLATATIIVPQSSISKLVWRKGPYADLDAEDVRQTILSIAFDSIDVRRILVAQLEDTGPSFPEDLRQCLARRQAQWIFEDRRLLKLSLAMPHIQYADGGGSPEKERFVADEAGRVRATLKYAAHPLTRQASFELIIRHYMGA